MNGWSSKTFILIGTLRPRALRPNIWGQLVSATMPFQKKYCAPKTLFKIFRSPMNCMYPAEPQALKRLISKLRDRSKPPSPGNSTPHKASSTKKPSTKSLKHDKSQRERLALEAHAPHFDHCYFVDEQQILDAAEHASCLQLEVLRNGS